MAQADARTGRRGGGATRTPARQGKIPLTVYVSDDVWKRFRIMLIERNSTAQAALHEAVLAMIGETVADAAPSPPPRPAVAKAVRARHWSSEHIDLLWTFVCDHGGNVPGERFDALAEVIEAFLAATGRQRSAKSVKHKIAELRRTRLGEQ